MEHIKNNLVKVTFLMVSVIWGCNSPRHSSPPQESEMKLVWADEFDYTGAPDSTKWGYDLGNGCPNLCGWGNNELQTYTDHLENARVEDGFLVIEAHKEKLGENDYTSARLVSKQKGDFMYGKYEIRAKLPKGKGTWAAIWMLPTEWKYGTWPASGEIDIMEFVGFEEDSIFQTVHTGAYNGMFGTQKSGQLLVENASDDFQVFTIDWTEEKIDFYVDERLGFTFKNEGNDTDIWPFNHPFYFIFNIAVGGNWGGKHGVDEFIWPQKMLVDYVRVYQDDSQKSLSSN